MTEEFKPIATQEELDALIRDRLKRDRAKTAEKYADYEDLKARAAKLDELEEAQKGELERANEKIAKLEKDAADRAAAEKARELKERVACLSTAVEMTALEVCPSTAPRLSWAHLYQFTL